MKVDGYDYPAFMRAVGSLRGRGCWVEALLRARRRAWLLTDARRTGGEQAEMPRALDPALLGCDGELDAHHVGIPKQRLKRKFENWAEWPVEFGPAWWVSLGAMLMDPRNGVIVCRRHHDLLERALVVPTRAELPDGVEAFAGEVGMGWSLERDFGPLGAAAAA